MATRSSPAKNSAALDPALPQKKRARRRLVGAAAIALAAAIVLPLVLDSEPRQVRDDVEVSIPSRDTPLPERPDGAAVAGPAGPITPYPATLPDAKIDGAAAGPAGTDDDDVDPAAAERDDPPQVAKADGAAGPGGTGGAAAGAAGAAAGAAIAGSAGARAAAKPADAPKALVEARPEPRQDTKAGAAAKADAADARAAAKSDPKPDARSGAAKGDAKPEPKQLAKADDAGAAVKGDAKADAKGDTKGDTKGDAKADAKADAKGDTKPTDARPHLLQAGAFATEKAAAEQVGRLRKVGVKTYTEKVRTGQGERIRVRVGPFASREAADRARAKLKSAGIDSALVAP